jgi:isopentenyl-diphosphate delta-isomerase type 1
MTATESGPQEWVILVNENDQEIGICEKLAAHQENLLHRAFSIFIFQKDGEKELELLLQQRSLNKYHSPGLWTNTCCSHPRQNENLVKAGERRLYEEMGVETKLLDIGWFHYNAHFPNGLSENEIDHVLIGQIAPNYKITINPAEVHAYRWISLAQLKQELREDASQFTPWLEKALDVVERHIPEIFGKVQ